MMAKLDISKSNGRIRIYLFEDRIRIRKSYEASIQEVVKAEINWAGIALATSEFANEFVGWLTQAAELAESLDRFIETKADFGQIVVEPWPAGSSGEQRGSIKAFKHKTDKGKIFIYHPAAWVKD